MPTNAKILCKAMPRDQLYDYTAFRGQHLRQLIGSELGTLNQIQDPEELKKEVGRLEKEAHGAAIGDMLSGRKPVLK